MALSTREPLRVFKSFYFPLSPHKPCAHESCALGLGPNISTNKYQYKHASVSFSLVFTITKQIFMYLFMVAESEEDKFYATFFNIVYFILHVSLTARIALYYLE